MKAAAIALGSMVLLGGCAMQNSPGMEYEAPRRSTFSELVAALDRAEAKWTAENVRNYSLHIRRGGVFGGSVFAVTYRGALCQQRHIKDDGAPSSFNCKENSMPQLFVEVRKEIASGKSDVSLFLDPELGYIHSFGIEPNTDFPDQGWGVEITNFKVLR